jgi:hypothetical protein
MMKRGTLSLRSYAYAYFMHAPSVDIIYCLVVAPFPVKTDVIKYYLLSSHIITTCLKFLPSKCTLGVTNT